jgi:flagellar protein FliS
MNYAQARRSYQKIAMETVSPGQRTLMLFDGAVRFLEKALAGFEHKDPLEFNQTINNNIQRAQAIIRELNGVLDMRAGGEFSDKMRQLYFYLDRRLQESNIRKQKAGVKEVLGMMTTLRDAWAEMLRQQETGTTPADGPAVPAVGGLS